MIRFAFGRILQAVVVWPMDYRQYAWRGSVTGLLLRITFS